MSYLYDLFAKKSKKFIPRELIKLQKETRIEVFLLWQEIRKLKELIKIEKQIVVVQSWNVYEEVIGNKWVSNVIAEKVLKSFGYIK